MLSSSSSFVGWEKVFLFLGLKWRKSRWDGLRFCHHSVKVKILASYVFTTDLRSFFPFASSFHRQIIKKRKRRTKRMGKMKEIPKKKKGFACRDCKLALLLEKVNVRKITKYLFSPSDDFQQCSSFVWESNRERVWCNICKSFQCKAKKTPETEVEKFHVEKNYRKNLNKHFIYSHSKSLAETVQS